MDLLFKRYASPFVLLDSLIMTNSLNNFVDDFFDFVREDNEWEFFLHKVYEQSWSEFSDSIRQSDNQEPIDLGATIKKSKNMLNNFTPEGEV